MNDDDLRRERRDLIDEIRGYMAHRDWHDTMAKDTQNTQPMERRHWLHRLIEGMAE